MKHLKFLAAVCCMLAVFTACEKNEPNDNGNGSNTGNYNANGHEYVDLGLSVKWATCNVGATKPEEDGNLYAWGEISTKSTHDWSTYKWCNDSFDTQTKYCTNSSYNYGTVDNKTVLDPEDDAAHLNWGDAWRMPTKAEWTELLENCTLIWAELNNRSGYQVFAPNGNSIFLPYTVNDWDWGTCYWSSSLDTDRPFKAWGVRFWNDYDVYGIGDERCNGQYVRPVLGE